MVFEKSSEFLFLWDLWCDVGTLKSFKVPLCANVGSVVCGTLKILEVFLVYGPCVGDLKIFRKNPCAGDFPL